jgi:hypothetical protein
MPILNKNLPPPPAPIELTPEQKRLDEARKRIGKLSPELIEDVRLLCNAAVDAGAIQIEDKAAIKKRLGYSIDEADACALSVADGVTTRTKGGSGGRPKNFNRKIV